MMQKNWVIMALTLVLAVLVTFSVSSCAKKKISSEPATTTSEEEAQRRAEEEARQKELERQRALEEEDLGNERLREEMAEQKTPSARALFENEDVFGDGVNIASRIQAFAVPGSIYVSEAIHLAGQDCASAAGSCLSANYSGADSG